ncbi:hypothetical protein PoB_000453500 [Plakobranchus ocellatus]|uniref:Uncharacterized protein n=1 Tax=Plakobranchus ocellatus TaxID=259542 RepID=A0AAV3Y5E4_9GAST|nr:hypothetical protein PoB_000453500 [Plakobranchus ocellatus]
MWGNRLRRFKLNFDCPPNQAAECLHALAPRQTEVKHRSKPADASKTGDTKAGGDETRSWCKVTSGYPVKGQHGRDTIGVSQYLSIDFIRTGGGAEWTQL